MGLFDFFRGATLDELRAIHDHITRLENLIMATNAENVVRIDALTARIEKVRAEIVTLKGLVGGGSPEIDAAISRAEAALGLADDENPDGTVPDPEDPAGTNPPATRRTF